MLMQPIICAQQGRWILALPPSKREKGCGLTILDSGAKYSFDNH
jgi:hypothetical protein